MLGAWPLLLVCLDYSFQYQPPIYFPAAFPSSPDTVLAFRGVMRPPPRSRRVTEGDKGGQAPRGHMSQPPFATSRPASHLTSCLVPPGHLDRNIHRSHLRNSSRRPSMCLRGRRTPHSYLCRRLPGCSCRVPDAGSWMRSDGTQS